MKLTEKYVRLTDKDKEGNKDKIAISDDAYSLVDSIQSLIREIRVKW